MKYLALLFAAFALTACSIEGMVEKAVPENVRADHMAHIDSLLAKDPARLEAAFDLDPRDEVQWKILRNVPEGNEIRRDYVGMNSASSFSSSEGKTRDINLVTEIQTEGGFMTVTGQYGLGVDGECCVLTNINAVYSDTSPIRAGLEALKKAAKIAGIIILLILGGLAFFLIRKRRKRLAA